MCADCRVIDMMQKELNVPPPAETGTPGSAPR
jgi:hypothetical protein